jgi:hypothetical protein
MNKAKRKIDKLMTEPTNTDKESNMNYPRVNYEMSVEDENELLDACRPVPYIIVGGMAPRSPQENANDAWRRLGDKMGFDYMTVRPGKTNRDFSALPTETDEQRKTREAREADAKKIADIAHTKDEILRLISHLEELEAK